MKIRAKYKAIKQIFKDFSTPYNSRNLGLKIGISHVGTYKILKELEKSAILRSKRIGQAIIYSLNFESPLTQKELDVALTLEAQNYRRWLEEFRLLKEKVKVLVIFGSILKNEKTAGDIDILVIGEENNYKIIKEIVKNRDELSNKKIHLIFQKERDFLRDIEKSNRVSLEILRTGIVLFGQNELINMLRPHLK